MGDKAKVLVTGADQHQGLAVIRGFGLAGIPVVAGGPRPDSLGLRSRFATERFVYTSPALDKARFVADVLAALERTGARLVVPAIESTLVVLDEHRREIERLAPLAAASSESLAIAVDKSLTMRLAAEVGVPAPVTICCDRADEALEQAARVRFPVALKPRGNALHGATAHHLRFKVRYATSLDELRAFLESLPPEAGIPLIQESARGTGVCVSAVCDRGTPLVLFPYRRSREVPLSGGVSVLRESIPLDPRLGEYVTKLLSKLAWHGVAMVEFKHDVEEDRYVLMEINPRFQASTALSLDAGLNLPHLVAHLFGCVSDRPDVSTYRVGVRERWLEGDFHALCQHLCGGSADATHANPRYVPPSKWRAVCDFLRDFRPGTRYDEFKRYDLAPSVVALRGLLAAMDNWGGAALHRLWRAVWRRGPASRTGGGSGGARPGPALRRTVPSDRAHAGR